MTLHKTPTKTPKCIINGQSVCSEDNQDKEVNYRNVTGESNQLNTES